MADSILRSICLAWLERPGSASPRNASQPFYYTGRLESLFSIFCAHWGQSPSITTFRFRPRNLVLLQAMSLVLEASNSTATQQRGERETNQVTTHAEEDLIEM